MTKKLYNVMDWAAVEEIVYGESQQPSAILGPHTLGRQTLVQALFPGAQSVSLLLDGPEGAKGRTVKEEVVMEQADEAGFYAALLPGAVKGGYRYQVTYPAKPALTDAKGGADEDQGGKRRAAGGRSSARQSEKKTVVRELRDPYAYGRVLTEAEEERFLSGGDTRAYAYMGSHKKTVGGVRGVVFRVWAPNARRVSLVGDFNGWNGLSLQMNHLGESGIYELFVPGLEAGAAYQYEILLRGGGCVCKADPYSRQQDGEHHSLVVQEGSYRWGDEKWMSQRGKKAQQQLPLNLYELSLAEEMQAAGTAELSEVAVALAKRLKSEGYTHALLLPVMDAPDSNARGFHTGVFLAPEARLGVPADYRAVVDALHRAGLGALITWSPADISNAVYGLAGYDGSCLYEYADPARGIDPRTGLPVLDVARPQVRTYLLCALRYWLDAYHVDGFCTADLSAMLYLDYYRTSWTPNIYGGVENLESIVFLQAMNGMLHQEAGVLSIASEAGAYGHVTGTEEGGLGFDYVTDAAMMRELVDYLSKDPIERAALHHELIGSAQYQYCERYLLPVSHELLGYLTQGVYAAMAGDEEQKRRNYALLYGWQLLHVGRKLHSADGAAAEDAAIVAQANAFYAAHPALYAAEDEAEGFAWINDSAANDNVVTFLRRGGGEELLCVFNFANVSYDRYRVGVPRDGKYQEIYSSAVGKLRTVAAREEACDGRERSLSLTLAPLSYSVFRYVPYTDEERAAISEHREAVRAQRAEEARRREALEKARADIRASLREEMARRIAEAEEVIAAGGVYTVTEPGDGKGRKKRPTA